MLKKSVSLVSVLLLAIVAVVGQTSIAKADDNLNCQDYSLPVTLSAIDPTVYHISGQFCAQGSAQGKTVQILVHGFTYDHNYWDFPMQPGIYSYVRHATGVGYATFNYDRPGVGQSDHPLSTNVSVDSNAFVLRQLVQGLRSGSIAGQSFSKVVTVGHSEGSGIALIEASRYADVDGIILSDFLHTFSATGAGAFFAALYPASLDPKFTQANLDPGYLTTMPGTRGPVFYNTAVADPNVIALDGTLKQTGTATESATTLETIVPTVSLSVHVPVLLAVGQNDALFCDNLLLSCANDQAVLNREARDYSSDACLEVYILPTAGHVINLHPNAHSWFKAAADWVNRRVGVDSTTPATQTCTH